ncbi:hypothetical protein CDAR_369381 [Caerostris darwini]|uniref:Uncharacterized protein n=1 Tax=Caerostris darwini TaxID=1538125 RepID=A0AAV4RXP1_9ARAC|nr:hypothetical protein CDAR_369381 [Caerostris darwini]
MKSTCHFPKQCAESPRIRRLLLGRKQSKARRAICFPRPAINIQPVSTLQRSLRCTQKTRVFTWRHNCSHLEPCCPICVADGTTCETNEFPRADIYSRNHPPKSTLPKALVYISARNTSKDGETNYKFLLALPSPLPGSHKQ